MLDSITKYLDRVISDDGVAVTANIEMDTPTAIKIGTMIVGSVALSTAFFFIIKNLMSK